MLEINIWFKKKKAEFRGLW